MTNVLVCAHHTWRGGSVRSSFSASSRSASSLPAGASASSWRSQATASNAANQRLNSARAEGFDGLLQGFHIGHGLSAQRADHQCDGSGKQLPPFKPPAPSLCQATTGVRHNSLAASGSRLCRPLTWLCELSTEPDRLASTAGTQLPDGLRKPRWPWSDQAEGPLLQHCRRYRWPGRSPDPQRHRGRSGTRLESGNRSQSRGSSRSETFSSSSRRTFTPPRTTG